MKRRSYMINFVVCVQIHTLKSLLYDMVACYIIFLNDFRSFIFLKNTCVPFCRRCNFCHHCHPNSSSEGSMAFPSGTVALFATFSFMMVRVLPYQLLNIM
jgi:hypothetical protein